jgi:AcrR family transcriptional regulator
VIKGDQTRHAVLERATALASRVGLGGVTIGTLASELGMSKSGLFGHFHSKEALQLQVLDSAAALFQEFVVRPAFRESRGEPRMRAVFERWLAWGQSGPLPGGCVFAAAATEFDDRPGPVRERLAALQREWFVAIATAFRLGVAAGAFRRDADPEQFAQDLFGIMYGFYHTHRLLRDPRAEARARRAFERVLASVRATGGHQEES